MDLLQVLFVSLLGILSTCSGKVTNYRGSSIFFTDTDPVEQIPVCRYENKPCMIMVREYYANGTLKGEFRSSNICQCGRGNTCPTTWDGDRERTITRYLRTRGNVMSLQLKFCQPVQAQRVCEPHEVALSLKGGSIVPQEVTSVNCTCAHNEPLYKQKVWYDREARSIRNENYVCSMPDCASGNVTCLLFYRGTTRRETTYLCRCPDHMQCRNFPRRTPDTPYAFGNCRNEQ